MSHGKTLFKRCAQSRPISLGSNPSWYHGACGDRADSSLTKQFVQKSNWSNWWCLHTFFRFYMTFWNRNLSDVSGHNFVERELDRCATIKKAIRGHGHKTEMFLWFGAREFDKNWRIVFDNELLWIIYFVTTKFRSCKTPDFLYHANFVLVLISWVLQYIFGQKESL